ncbi:hypothetical protein NL108_012744 [Boleophthalmus pectinirostris]|uniref:immediate early response gene 2 protein n=1 Tax=Boleophthalmus pectinirostris TaxID=150288 RepID=UPI000A1C4D5F|nr:immediate early response gene 2 protein [Boleophthalmus pectinirostris]KAJ0058283.1 hypothetical protein NL108_012744 [Boleophthalmus pectinirostris]
MEVGAEAKRIMVVALGKLYSSRSQRGGLRLHRSLLLTLVMKSARDMYHAAAQEEEEYSGVAPSCDPAQTDLTPDPNTTAQTVEPEHFASEEVSDAVTQPEPMEQTQQTSQQTFTHGPTQHSRKRRGKISAVPDFLPLKKAKLDCPTQLVVLVDYVTCSDLGAAPSPIPVPMAIAAC